MRARTSAEATIGARAAGEVFPGRGGVRRSYATGGRRRAAAGEVERGARRAPSRERELSA